MRLMYRVLVLGAFLVPCVAAGVTAQPPSSATEKLKSDTSALAGERTAAESTTTERAKLQADLRRLIDRLEKTPPGPGVVSPTSPPVSPPKTKDKDPGAGGASVDKLRAAMNLVLNNEIDAALNAFRQIDLQSLSAEDRSFARFMTASCLRRQGRMAEALPIYREVGDSGEDAFIASSAVSQVALIRTGEELQAQLTQLRARPKSR
ncbi:abc transporter substrate-binding protein : [Gemmata massiliana]|uniref:Abc transporter substrate-binding protein n=1 Tax=Gemmata massiliana TaxID=1210884 RepID=A0A6P2DA41_9BACT|nr:hypothetical protein [Gemmata massiliana]VTR96380.1 abc transporter substrate-binding protein : [Gemmata massiliana]